MNKQEAQAYIRRYRLVNAYERKEAKCATIATRARQLNALIGMAKALPHSTTDRATQLTRKRWNQLRKAHHDRSRV